MGLLPKNVRLHSETRQTMPTTEDLLNTSRRELLDLSTRNRLLSIPVDSSSAKIIQIRDELTAQVFRMLVTEKRSFSFLPGRPSAGGARSVAAVQDPDIFLDDGLVPALPQPEEEHGGDELDQATGLPKRQLDNRLQTSFTPEGLQRRLLDLYHDSRAMIEEQGVNILYLAMGHLKW